MIDRYVNETAVRVRYAETDQMGIAHHSVYLVWCELGRTQLMRGLGVTYRDLEDAGIRLPVVEVKLRCRAPARYDEVLTVRSWVRLCRSRQVQFGNAITLQDKLLATAEITLVAIGEDYSTVSIPTSVRELLVAVPDPIRL